MAKDEPRDGQAEYGTVHVMEKELRDAEQGVFEPKSGEAGRLRRKRAEAPANKMVAAPSNKATKRGGAK